MPVLRLDHIQLAIPAGHEDQPLAGYGRLYVDDPFGNRIELMEPTVGGHGG